MTPRTTGRLALLEGLLPSATIEDPWGDEKFPVSAWCALLVSSLSVVGAVAVAKDSLSASWRESRPVQPQGRMLPALARGGFSMRVGHAYAGGIQQVWQFPLTGGIIASQPDGRLTGVGAPAAIGPGGGLFATAPGDGHSVAARVELFSTPQLSLLRTLNVAFPKGKWLGMTVSALALDHEGYLYVGYVVRRPPSAVQRGIFVYRPFAMGNATPTVTIPERTGVGGMAFDAQGNLYVSRTSLGDILVYASPSTQPVLTRSLGGGPIHHPSGLRIDSTNELYVACLSNESSTYVLAYPDTASGHQRPDRQIVPLGAPPNTLPRCHNRRQIPIPGHI